MSGAFDDLIGASRPLAPPPLHRSIRGRLTLFLVVLIVGTTAAITLSEYLVLSRVLRTSIEKQLQLYGQGLSEAIGAYGKLQQERVLLVSSRTRLRQVIAAHHAGEIGVPECQAATEQILVDAVGSAATFRSIRIADPQGRVVAASNPVMVDEEVSADEAFRAGREGVYMAIPRLAQGEFVTTLSAPLRSADGAAIGVVMADVDAGPLQRLVQAFISGHDTAQVRIGSAVDDGIRYVLPVAGVPAMTASRAEDPSMALALARERGFVDRVEFGGREVAAVYSPTGYADWGLVVQLDTDEAYAALGQPLSPMLWTGLLLCLVAILVGLRLAASFVRPVRELSRAAMAIERGEFGVRAIPVTQDEMGMLGHAFNHMARALEKYRNTMLDMVAAQTSDLRQSREQLRQAKDRAEHASQAKTRFLASVSHEIRTPMNGILGMTELLLESQLELQQRSRVEVVQDSGRLLLRLLNDILDLSKVEAGKLVLGERDFSIRQLANSTVQPFEPAANKKGLRLECVVDENGEDFVRGASDRLRQILTNLISNAIKFTDAGSVRLEMAVTPFDDGYRLHAKVVDTGIGIAADQQHRVFERFEQVDYGSDESRSGSGLGLTISSRLAERMHGTLTLDSEVGKGSVFSLEVPLARAKGQPGGTDAVAPERLLQDPVRVLLVEDGEVNREVATSMLRLMGHDVLVARNGEQALRILAERSVDIVFMDVQMPVMGGFEATSRIREQEQGQRQHLPIVGLSAHALQGFRERCLAAGMDDFLTKPVSMHDFDRALFQWAGVEQRESGAGDEGGAQAAEPDAKVAALQRVGGVASILDSLVDKFTSEAPRLFDELVAALEAGAVEDCHRAAHTIKGSADFLGLTDLSEVALRMEQHAAAEELDDVRLMVKDLDLAVRDAIANVASW